MPDSLLIHDYCSDADPNKRIIKIINTKGGRSPINLKLHRVINFGMRNSNMALVFEIDKDLINYS